MVPSSIDGLKITQRKVLSSLFQLGVSKEIKIIQLTGTILKNYNYQQGQNAIYNAIFSLAQNYVGSNNLNLLQPIGQYGTRYFGGKDSALPKYLSTYLTPLARFLFP